MKLGPVKFAGCAVLLELGFASYGFVIKGRESELSDGNIRFIKEKGAGFLALRQEILPAEEAWQEQCLWDAVQYGDCKSKGDRLSPPVALDLLPLISLPRWLLLGLDQSFAERVNH
jgi:hypothetical protein